jgi:uncharacterized repeat protein (TIGR03803 family)
LRDDSGIFYGTTSEGGDHSQGAVFSLTPPIEGQTAWTEKVIFSFNAHSTGYMPTTTPLVKDSTGALYGATHAGGNNVAGGYSCGVLFKLTPPGGGHTVWTETVLYRFKGELDGCFPGGPIVLDESGAVYGATGAGGGSGNKGLGWGTLFKLTPPETGHTVWTETVLHRFTGGADGGAPVGGLVTDGAGAFYGTTGFGGSSGNNGNGWGTVFKLTP